MSTTPAFSDRAYGVHRPGHPSRRPRYPRPDIDPHSATLRLRGIRAGVTSEQRGTWSARDDEPGVDNPDGVEDRGTRQRSQVDDEDSVRGRRSPAADEDAAFERLDEAVDDAIGLDLDVLSDDGLTRRLDRLHRPIARLGAERARLTAELERRRVAATGEPAARQAARREVRRQLAQRANTTPAATKRDADAGRIADQHPLTGASFADGDLSADHVRLIGETLSALEPDRRAEVEVQLLAVAQRTNPTQFGKHARAILVREAPASSDVTARRQHRLRRVRTYDTPDGGFAFSGLLYGDMAESARVAFDAFRRPDTPDEHRSPEQRSADAFEQLCAAALRVGEAPTRHGVRPHVIISMTVDDLALGDGGAARLGSGQPATLRQLRTLLADCSWSRVVLRPDSTPIEASKTVRTVPAGLWRVLVTRDAGCTWPGCDAPPNWCDVAHGAVAFSDDGQLSPGNAALLCRRHHRRFDLGGWRIVIEGDTVGYHREGDGPASTRSAGSPDTGQDRATDPGLVRSEEEPGRPQPRARGRPEDDVAERVRIERSSRVAARPSDVEDGEQISLPLPPPMADP